jgi:SM-20-related protein
MPINVAAGPSIDVGASIDAGPCIAAGLRVDGIAIQDEFLAPPQVRSLLECVHLRRARGDFAAARIGSQSSLRRREEVRGDSTCWMVAPLLPAEQVLLDELERLRLALNRTAWLGLSELELHYAWYAPGTGYARHVDQPHGRTQRQVSLVLYLNEDWQPADGGVLRLHETDDRTIDIEPVGGRLVCFLTLGRVHEVLTAKRERLSISGWFRGRE